MSETKTNPNWHPETWGGPRPGSGRPTLGGDEDPTVTVTVLMPLSLKRAAIEIGDGNMSLGIRVAIAVALLSKEFLQVSDKLSASEAVFGFAGWLTSRSERVVMSSKDDSAIVADLVAKFCEANHFDEPREGWHNNLVHPKEA